MRWHITAINIPNSSSLWDKISSLFLIVGKNVDLKYYLSALLAMLFNSRTCSSGTLEGPRRPSLHREDPHSPCRHWLAAEWWPGAESASWLRGPLEWGSLLTSALRTDKSISKYQFVWRSHIASSDIYFDIPAWEASSSLIIS